MSIEVVAILGSAIGGLISFFLGCSVGRWAKSRAFRSTILACDVKRIVVNPSSDNPRTFVPESENAKLRELVRWMYDRMDESCAVQHPYAPAPISYDLLMQALARVRELGIEVDE